MTGTFLVSGLIFGLSAGLTPGPILTLVIYQTLKHGIKEGVKVAMAPLLTDVPIVIVSLFLLARMSNMKSVLGLLSIFGGIYLFYLAYESIRFKGANLNNEDAKPQSIKRGVMANFLNPNPYIFWISIGGPLVLKASQVHIAASILFIVPFYALLVGSKCMVAVISGNSRGFLKSTHYIITIRALGCILIIFGILFVRDGLTYFGLT
jgi:threonine/homoserine/homoserine lactone efflux protein